LGALITVLLMRPGRTGGGTTETPPFAAQGGGAPAIDISQMSPEERATRLYNRVMRLAEEGKNDSVQFFLPMALQTYGQLPALDNDARYHIGVLDLAGGDAAGALAEADSIVRTTPTHLFAFMLRARAYQASGNGVKAKQAFRDFLKNEAAERSRSRPEYSDHKDSLDAFHADALKATAGR
jgi:Flp pilus assembly protein TadD